MSPAAISSGVDLDELRDRYLQAQLRGDRREALRLVVEDGVERGAGVMDVHDRVISAAQREIGRLWEENTISVAQEHMATAISQLALAHLFQHAPEVPSVGRRVVVACIEGELHDFPARLAADALELAGFEVKFLSANVPTESLVTSVRTESPDLVALSATMPTTAGALRTAVDALRRRGPAGVRIAIGGRACSEELANDLGVDAWGREAADLVDACGRLFGTQQHDRGNVR